MGIRLILFGAVLVLLHLYVWRSLLTIQGPTVDAVDWVIRVIFWSFSLFSIAILGILMSGISEGSGGLWRNYVFSLFAIWVCFLVLLSLFLGVDDVRRVIVWLANRGDESEVIDNGRNRFIVNMGLLVAGIPFVSFIYGMMRNMYNFRKREISVPIDNLPKDLEGFRIIQLSDIHAGTFSRKGPIRKAIESINNEKPDLIVFTGDLVNEVVEEMDPWIDVFGQLKAKYGVYSVLGNHDYGDYAENPTYGKEEHMRRMKDTHRRLGWQLLMDDHRILQVGQATLGLLGIENASGKKFFKMYGDIARAYPKASPTDVKILLSHDPSYWRYAILDDYADINLTLSGHTHGMQCGIEIPGFLRWSPVRYVYQEWAGLYTERKQSLYVNRGFGCLAYPGRVGILPEISILKLVKS